MKLLVQEFLETHSFKELQEQHGVYCSLSKSGHKWSLNYDQIEAKESDPLAQECRGLILAREDGAPIASPKDDVIPGKTTVLAYPMKRFFNYGQSTAAQIDWADPKMAVLEKLDGTLCIMYFDKFINRWCIATRSVPEADLLMDNGLFTFRTLFEKAVQDTLDYHFEQLCAELNEEFTYCFELTTPYNRIVVAYPDNRITLLAARSLVTMKEVDPNTVTFQSGVPVVHAYTHATIQDTLDWVASLNPMEHEGVVVRQGENRIKVKNPAYVAYNKVRDCLATSERNVMELILSEKDDDVVPFLPEEIVKNLQKLKAGVQVVLREHDEMYSKARAEADAKAPGDKKTFAILVTSNKALWSAPFFHMWDGKSKNMRDFFAKTRKDGTWPNGMLDKVLELAKQANP